MKRILLIGGALAIIAVSFGFLFNRNTPSDVLNRNEYIKWVESESNGLINTQTSGDLSYEITYCPLEYIIAKEFRTEQVREKAFQIRYKEIKGLQYFKLRIRRAKSNEEVLTYNLEGGQQGYYQRVDYLSYGLDEDLFLIENNFGDTLSPVMYHFERTYGVAPYIDFLISFPEDSLNKDPHKVFMFNDKILGGGLIRADFNTNKIIDSPKLLVK